MHILKNKSVTNEIIVGVVLFLRFRQKTNGHVTVQLALTVSFFTEPSNEGLIRRHFHLLWIHFSKVNVVGQIRILVICLGPKLTFTLNYTPSIHKK